MRALEVVENTSDAVALFDFEWRCLYVNSRAESIARTPRSQVLGKILWDVFPDAGERSIKAQLQRAMGERAPTRFEGFYKPFDLWVEVNAYPTVDGMALLVRDVSEQKRSEQKLRESEERYRRLFEATSDGILIVDDRGCYVDVNESLCRILKAPREQLIGAHFAGFIPPERLAEAQQAFEQLRRGDTVPVDFPLRAADGSIVELAWTSSSDYLPGLYFCSCREIGHRKKAEREMQTLLAREQKARETAELLNGIGPMLLADLDQEKLVEKVIDVATRATGAEIGCFLHHGLNERRELTAMFKPAGPRSKAFAAGDGGNALFLSTLRANTAKRRDDVSAEIPNGPYFKTPSGAEPVRSCIVASIQSRHGDVLGGLFFGHSEAGRFGERQQSIVLGIAAQAAIALDNARLFEQAEWVQKELKRSNDDLRRANKDLETFAYSASHDLQEPLRNVSLSTQLLQRALKSAHVPEDTSKFLEGILSGAQRMENLVRDLLAYARATQHKEAPHCDVDATGVLAGVLMNLKSRVDSTGARITSENLPVISMHQVHLAQLFQNLISNAIKYRGNESPRIQITAKRENGWWVFSVADNGIGVDPRYWDQIFGLFKRLHTRDEYPGSGIGLAICQRIVEQYGGKIWLERSAPGQGSVFCFSLPE